MPVRPRRRADRRRRRCMPPPGRRCSTASCASGRRRRGERFVPFDPVADYDEYVDGKPRDDGVRSFLASRGIDLPEGEPRTIRPATETVAGLGNRKNEIVLRMIREQGVEAYEGSVRYVRAAREAGLAPRGRLVEHQLPRGAGRGGDRGPVRAAHRRSSSPSATTCGASPPRTRSWPGRGRSASRPSRRRSSRTRSPASRPGGPAASAAWSGSTGSARPTRCARTAPTSSSPTSRSCSTRDRASRVRRRAVGAPRDRARPRRARPDASRCSRWPTGTSGCAATSTRASRTACPAPTSTASTSRARCPTPRPATATPRRARRSSTSPTARSSGCWSTTSRSTSATASCRSHERTLDLRAGVLRRRVEWASPAGRAVRVSSVRLVSFAQRAVAAILYEVEPLDSAARLVVQSELVANEPMPTRAGDPRAPRRAGGAAALRAVLRPRRQRRARALHQARAGCGWPPAMDHVVEGRPGPRRAGRERRRPRARDDHRRRRAGRAAARGQVPRLRLVEPALDGGAARPGRRRAGRGAPHRLGRAARRPARLPRRLLGPRRRRARRRRRAPAGGALRALPHPAGRRPRRAARDRRQGPDRPGYDGHAFWDTETFVLPVLTYTAPHAARDALRWRHATLDLARERAEAARPRRARRSPGARSTARSARATGRRAPPPSTSTPTSPTPSAATRRDRRRGVRARGRARAARRDGAAVALARPPRRRGTVSHRRRHRPRRVQRRSPTTTSTPT